MVEQFHILFDSGASLLTVLAALPGLASSQLPLGRDLVYGALMMLIGGLSAVVVRMLVTGVLKDAESRGRLLAHTASIASLMIMALIAPDEMLIGVGIFGAMFYVLLETLMPHRQGEEEDMLPEPLAWQRQVTTEKHMARPRPLVSMEADGGTELTRLEKPLRWRKAA